MAEQQRESRARDSNRAKVDDGVIEYHNAILVEPHHCNTWEMTHGSFIGALGEIAAPGGYEPGGPPVVIIDLNMHFIGTAKAGQWIEMVGTINRKTRSLVFAEGRGMANASWRVSRET